MNEKDIQLIQKNELKKLDEKGNCTSCLKDNVEIFEIAAPNAELPEGSYLCEECTDELIESFQEASVSIIDDAIAKVLKEKGIELDKENN